MKEEVHMKCLNLRLKMHGSFTSIPSYVFIAFTKAHGQTSPSIPHNVKLSLCCRYFNAVVLNISNSQNVLVK
jgi:hypothetical protein